MPVPTRLYGAVWFFLFVLRPLLARLGSKPRLEPVGDSLNLMLCSERNTRHVTRLSPAELNALAADLLIDAHADAARGWRFSPLHRLILFLIPLTNAWPSRKLRLLTGWAANAVLNNWRYHVGQIIACLDVPGGGLLIRCMLALSVPFAHSPSAVALQGWTLAEQDAWIAAPSGPAAFRSCIGVVDATYIRIERPADYATERRYYSTYKKYHAMFFLAIIDRQGECALRTVAVDVCTCSSVACLLLRSLPRRRWRESSSRHE